MLNIHWERGGRMKGKWVRRECRGAQSSGNGFAGKGGHRTVNTTDNSTVPGLGACVYERREKDRAVIPRGLGHRAEGELGKRGSLWWRLCRLLAETHPSPWASYLRFHVCSGGHAYCVWRTEHGKNKGSVNTGFYYHPSHHHFSESLLWISINT